MRFNPEKDTPCIRGCMFPQLVEGEEEEPKPARYGMMCSSCYYRMMGALKLVPDLMANMRLHITPKVGSSFIPAGPHSKPAGSPVPLLLDPLDASDSLFAKLVSWTEVFAGEFHTAQPSVAVWINFKEVQGSRPVTPQTAHDIATQLADWFKLRLEAIADSDTGPAFHDDLCYGWTEARGVFSLAAAYGVERPPARPAEKRECPVCGRNEVFVAWPDKFNSDLRIMCDRCKWVAEPDMYGHYAEMFKTA